MDSPDCSPELRRIFAVDPADAQFMRALCVATSLYQVISIEHAQWTAAAEFNISDLFVAVDSSDGNDRFIALFASTAS